MQDIFFFAKFYPMQGGLKSESSAFDAYIFKTLEPLCITLARLNAIIRKTLTQSISL